MISMLERLRRQEAINFARGNVRLEGCILDAEIERLNAAFIEGKLSNQEHSSACQAHILARKVRSQPSE